MSIINKSIIFFVMLGATCNTAKRNDELRKNNIQSALNAIRINDTISLYRVLDTTYLFDLKGKQGTKSVIEAIKKQLVSCEPNFQKDGTVKNKQYDYTNYTLELCGVNKLIFRFADYNTDNKIIYLEVKVENGDMDFKPAILPPKKE